MRTHVDINDPELTALRAILELREEVKDYIDIQIVAFPQYGILSYPNGKGLLEEALKMGADAAGAIPHLNLPVSILLNRLTSALNWRRNTAG